MRHLDFSSCMFEEYYVHFLFFFFVLLPNSIVAKMCPSRCDIHPI